MNGTFRIKTLTWSVAAALAQISAGAALADSAIGPWTTLGNALNPDTINTVQARDPEALDASPNERTPTGKLILWPPALPTPKETAGGWTYFGEIELGGLAVTGDEDSAWFKMYKDLDTGLYLNNLFVHAEQPDRGYFVEVLGGGVGYRDQYEGATFGRYNSWKAKLFYTEIPHVFTTTYRNLWSGVGSDYLALNGLTPGGTAVANPGVAANNNANAAATSQNIRTALQDLEDYELELVRKIGGLNVDAFLTNNLKLYASFSQEKREGSRPFGAVFGGGGGGGNVEIPESIDYTTNDFQAALRYDDGLNNLNLVFQGSWFRNNTGVETFENPLYITTNTIVQNNLVNPTTFKQGQVDLYPDNDYYNLRAEYARSFPEFYKTRVTATAAVSKMTQDDDLVPWTQYSLAGTTINTVPAANNWNTISALTRSSADAEIDTQLLDFTVTMAPTPKLDLLGKFRYYDTDNSTEFLACNPLTGQWGRLINDGSGGSFPFPSAVAGNNPRGTLTPATGYNGTGCDLGATQALGLVPNAGNIPIRNVPYEYSKINWELGAIYRLGLGQSINAKFSREEYDREYRERDETHENKFELGYVNQAFQWGTVRLNGTVASLRGDEYSTHVYHQFYSSALGPDPVAGAVNSWIHAPEGLRKFDLADRDTWELKGRLDVIATQDLNLGLVLQYRNNDYPDSDLGRDGTQGLGTASLDVAWQPSSKLSLYGFYTYQASRVEQTGLSTNACAVGTTYYFYNDGTVANGAPLAASAGKTLVYQTTVFSNTWEQLCSEEGVASPLWPESRLWTVETEDTNHFFGIGGRYDFGFARVELDYTYVMGAIDVDYTYNPNGQALFNATTGVPTANQPYVGSGMPDYDYDQQILNFNVLVPITKAVAVRLLYRYEQGAISDWHYDGVDINPNPTLANNNNNQLYLDQGMEDYSTSVFGLLVQVNF